VNTYKVTSHNKHVHVGEGVDEVCVSVCVCVHASEWVMYNGTVTEILSFSYARLLRGINLSEVPD
jgi:hypothetical protein